MATKKCHDGPCGPCSLCKTHSNKYTHPERFDREQYTFLCGVEDREISMTECLCYCCSKQIKRNVGNTKFRPRWQVRCTAANKCGIEGCTSEAKKKTQLASREEIECILGQPVTSFTVAETTLVPLCQVHYNEVYHLLHPKTCDACGIKPRKGENFNRHCPNPVAINTYLSIVTTDPSLLTDQSKICWACYNHFKCIEQNLEKGETTSNSVVVSREQRNTQIDAIISTLSHKMANIYKNRMNVTLSDYMDYTMCSTCKRLGEKMKVDEATLLPNLYKQFREELLDTVSFPNMSVQENDVPSSRWLLAQLYACFEGSIQVQCRQKRYGTLVYHKHCDLIQALTTALARNNNNQQVLASGATCDGTCSSHTCSTLRIEEQVSNVALFLNNKMHTRAKLLTNESPESIATTDFAAVLSSTDPLLLSFLSTLTQSVRQSKRNLFSEPSGISPRSSRLFYALCVLQFCTNSTCSVPLHILLTEAVLCHGGTLELVRILNRLGAVASVETVNRLATHVVQKRLSTGIQPELQPQMFTAVSVDNIDILQPYSFVSATDLTRSWHGTSVQCVQPHPFSGHLTSEDMLDPGPVDASNSGKHAPSSPIGTPIAVEKHKRRKRTLTEGTTTSPHTVLVVPEKLPHPHLPMEYERSTQTVCLEEFRLDATEQSVLHALQVDLFHSVLLRKFGSTDSGQVFPGLQSFINCIKKQTADREVSNITYVEIISERADSKQTLLGVISRLQQVFVQELKQKYVLVVGDAKTYNLLQAICYEYKTHLPWLLPFPGDWHILFNYQKALMKPFADAGLASLGKAAGHRAETLTSLLQASNFRRTHEFLLQAFEAFYRYFLTLYISKTKSPEEIKTLTEEVTALGDQFAAITTETELDTFRQSVGIMLHDTSVDYNDFMGFMDTLCRESDTVRFWYRFVSTDCLAYIGLFLSIRYRNWELRTGSIKELAAIFAAFDRPTYQQLIPRHIHELLLMPPHILHHLQRGSFSVRLSESEWHGVAIDECHEMRINKEAKLAVVHPSKHRMEFLSNYMCFRSACVESLKKQIFPETVMNRQPFSHAVTSTDKKREVNILRMVQAIESKDMTSLTGLWNFLEEKEATPEQAHDLLNCRSIGQEAYERFVEHKVIGLPSTSAPNRKKRLTTFNVTQVQKQRVKVVEKERKISQRYLKRQLSWISKQGTEGLDFNDLLGPISSLPRALIGNDGLPYKSNKSNTTEYLRKRYSSLPIITDTPPPQWTPHTAILEGMFLIQSSPLPSMGCMKDYALWLLHQYIRPHFRAGVEEVHVVFDTPGSMTQTPKELEKRRRDKGDTGKLADTHECTQITSFGGIPAKWRALLACRKCKQCLTVYLAHEMLELAPNILGSAQKFAANVGETTQSVTATGEMLPCPTLWSNADEADLRVWLHCLHSPGINKLLFSPDTDVYHIGLTVLPHLPVPAANVVVQLSKSFKVSVAKQSQ